MSSFPYTLSDPGGPALGLIVLQTDETIEGDFLRLFRGSPVRIYVSRVRAGAAVTPDMIAQMALDLPEAASMLPQSPRYGAVGYGCTSGTTLIGVDRVAALVQSGCMAEAVCDPLSAARAVCAHLGIRRLGLVSPYRADVAQPVCDAFESDGLHVTRAVHFGEEVEANVARITHDCVIAAAREVARHGDIDGIFLSCTNLRTLDVIGPLERELGVPVFGSNLALAWAMTRAAGLSEIPVGDSIGARIGANVAASIGAEAAEAQAVPPALPAE
ncbi:maleate cis-trans isomerase family protein [Antarctobacter heliothermus]|uniref:Maleate isomerase n=1 Tax=Antarctobacter heliothermus TaxID=74033 RepID=A0A239JN78_9RHOB|nr:Asp/Glu racemase [Antarctobacter heliothermus]SNT07476.1 maleate isomerase [Antarctobacter heliothermus]